MFVKMRRRLTCHLNAFKESFGWILERPLSSLMTIIILGIAFAVPVLFWILSNNIDTIAAQWKSSGYISLYASPSLSKQRISELVSEIKALPSVGNVHYISPEEGLALFQSQEGMHDIMQYLPDNPLPSVINVTPAVSVNTPAEVNQLYDELSALEGVDEAKMDMAWLTRIRVIFNILRSLGHILLLLVSCAVLLMVGNTLRLSIQTHRDSVQILKLVGATDSYITRPFLYSAINYTLGGAIFALILCAFFLWRLNRFISSLGLMYDMHLHLDGLSTEHVLTVLVFAIILGWFGAKLSIKRQLSTIEPCY